MNQTEKIALEVAKIKNLPPLPEASIRIITAVNDSEISIDELVEVILLSPVLTARLLGLANSAYFGRTGKIKDLRVAIIQILGLKLVKSLAISIILNVEMDTSKCKLFDANYFWCHALVSAVIAERLAIHINDELMSPSTVYTSALLLNIGLLVAVYLFPSELNDVFKNSDKTEGSVSKAMRLYLGQTQYELGGILLDRWQLPEVYLAVVKEFRQPEFEGKEKLLVELLELTHWISSYIVCNKQDDLPDVTGLLQRLSLPRELFDSVVTDVINNKDSIEELASCISG